MSGDDFERAIAALREQGDNPAPQARLTKERVLRELRPRARRRRAVWFIPLAALLAGSTVLAATGRLPDVYHAAARALGIEAPAPSPPAAHPAASKASTPAKPAATEAPPQVAPAPTEAPAQEMPSPNATATAADSAPPSSSATATTRRRGSKPEPKEAPSPPAAASVESSPEPSMSATASAEEDPALALYRHARQLHFAEQKPEAALAAWNAYLAADPHGPLAVDARYERALCLVRLGRKPEARAALEPFATGKYGSYRQDEARALLDALK